MTNREKQTYTFFIWNTNLIDKIVVEDYSNCVLWVPVCSTALAKGASGTFMLILIATPSAVFIGGLG